MEYWKTRKENRKLFEEIQSIAKLYFIALDKLKHQRRDCLCDKENETDKYSDYVRRIRNAYHSLNYLDQLFINNDFFYQEYANWWMKIYSRSTYYRLRVKSMKRFKEAVDNAE